MSSTDSSTSKISKRIVKLNAALAQQKADQKAACAAMDEDIAHLRADIATLDKNNPLITEEELIEAGARYKTWVLHEPTLTASLTEAETNLEERLEQLRKARDRITAKVKWYMVAEADAEKAMSGTDDEGTILKQIDDLAATKIKEGEERRRKFAVKPE
ncbi:hypothetical protein NA57DRAFT_56708 [Rhizodiscina lignyota]|uniref:Uncharacterized protein n=1 Tax=Rhizodiscina lignyota TaxID=1504668 RepID=A0A9P4IGA3_9PEZI|nr:hypothetical protein NA57DRAFT_56708 [Rhizodiscina lignyota]